MDVDPSTLPPLPLPEGIIETYVNTNDLTYHVLSAGHPGQPLIVCLHGFLGLAWSWHEVMPLLASGGYHVIAYDQRGYGRTTGWDTRPWEEVDLRTYAFPRLVMDAVRLVNALGYREVTMILGHDFGSVIANLCALIRPDIFKSIITTSQPITTIPSFPFNTNNPPSPAPPTSIALALLSEPRKPCSEYYSNPSANSDLSFPAEDLAPFLRQYFYIKSHAWSGNHNPTPHPLSSSSPSQLALLPPYCILPLHSTMKDVISSLMATSTSTLATAEWDSAPWLPAADLDVYVQEFQRTGFQGMLNWYRVLMEPELMGELQLWAGKRVEIPAMFVGGDRDWDIYQVPGALEGLSETNKKWYGVTILRECGHYPQLERPEELANIALGFLGEIRDRR